jgi:hypothetical protein
MELVGVMSLPPIRIKLGYTSVEKLMLFLRTNLE